MFKNFRNKLAKFIQPKETPKEEVVEKGPKVITKTKENPKEGSMRVMFNLAEKERYSLECFMDGKWKPWGLSSDNIDVAHSWTNFFKEKIGSELLPH